MRRLVLAAVCLLACTCGGCSYLGYQRYKPAEICEYDDMLRDLTAPGEIKQWVWVRGRISGDLDNDHRDEEVVAATLQEGKPENPGPVERAVLLICNRSQSGQPLLRLRKNVYQSGPSEAEAALPAATAAEYPRVRLQDFNVRIVDADGDDRGLVIVSAWGKETGVALPAWHRAFRLAETPGKAPELKPVFACLALQGDATVENADLDRDARDELLVSQRVLPPEAAAGLKDLPRPEWVSVFTPGADGVYAQADARFPQAYRQRMLAWYQNYACLLRSGAAAGTLAYYEYYIGLMHRYCDERPEACFYLEKAVAGAAAPQLKTLAERALAEARRPAIPAAPEGK